MDTLQCAVVLAKFERFDWEIERRLEVGARYTSLLGGLANGAMPVTVLADRDSVFAQYTLLVPNREQFQAELAARKVPTAVHYPIPLYRQPAYQALCAEPSFPVSEALSAQVVSLPMHPYIDLAIQERVAKAVAEAMA